MRAGRKPVYAERVMTAARELRTVAEIALHTGATEDCVRKALRRAADRGEVTIRRFRSGKCGRVIYVMAVL